MNTPQPPRLTPAQAEALQARFALKISARLDEGAQALPHDIGERLRIARQSAVAAAAQAQGATLVRPAAQASGSQVIGVALAGGGGGHSVNMGAIFPSGATVVRGQSRDVDHGRRLDDAPPTWGWRVASALPLLVLIAGLWAISAWYQQEQVQAAAEVDMALLSDELPPSAYADPGFEEYLRNPAGAPDLPAAQRADIAPQRPNELGPRVDAAVSTLPAQESTDGEQP